MSFATCIAAVLCMAATACGGAGASTFQSRFETSDAPPMKQLVVYESDDHPAFVNRKAAFDGGLVNRLKACGVTAHIIQADRLALDPAADIIKGATEFAADSVLLIRLVEVSPFDSALSFKLEVWDAGLARHRWIAKSQVTFNKWENDANEGLRFGTDVVTRLRDDGLVTGCPTAGWPAFEPDQVHAAPNSTSSQSPCPYDSPAQCDAR